MAIWLLAAGVLVVGGIAAWGQVSSNVEQAKYSVVEKHEDIEVRDYAPMIVAEVEVSGEREAAINQGFRMIADYIFGNNIAAEKVAMTAPVIQQSQAIDMTAPVIQQSGEKIAMTAPVTQQSANRKWKVRFVMPSAYTLSTLPTPRSEEVKLKEIPTTRYAAIRFSGTAGPESLKKKTQALEQFIERQHFTPLEASTYAFYNPPWTLPFLRRNEVLIKIQ